ncbi:hypothetical protein EON80_29995 [bacterium]|nr:MAG: hypothetical protein EON80_29995 [bacterium]
MRFDRQSDPNPIPVDLAISRGQLLVNGPVQLLLLSGVVTSIFVIDISALGGIIAVSVGFISAWLWWSYFIPQWREWAHQRGADPEELQYQAVRAKLTWPKGSLFERTEIRRRGR